MEHDLHAPYDFRDYDRIWKRVAPDLEPYPAPTDPAGNPLVAAMAEGPLPGGDGSGPQTPGPQLPGADPDPCCMGSAAEEMLAVLTGFIEEELSDRRHYLALAQQAPAYAQRRLRELADAAGGAAKRLSAVHYLITGTCYRPAVDQSRIHVGRWCPALRERYHGEACNGLNYIRAAEGTTDPCLRQLLTDLSRQSYRQAEQVLALLERAV